MKKYIKNNWPFILLIFIAVILHVCAFIYLGYDYTIKSDDASYIKSGIVFYKTGIVTMHGGVRSAQIMPGLTFIIAFFSLLFGTGTKLLIALKIFWMLMGIASVAVLYKIINLYANKYISALVSLFLLALDFVWMNNLILTETPFMLLFLLLVYYTLKIAEKPSWKYFILICAFYILCLFIRPVIAPYPIFLIIYLLIKKYDLKLLIKQVAIAIVLVIVVLAPWIYRNYTIYNKFIPLTYGSGNPLLLGTYQGYGYPLDKDLDYDKMDESLDPKLIKHVKEENAVKNPIGRYYLMEYDKEKAEYRMEYWWKNNKKSMLISYFVLKPKIMLFSSFYWDQLFGVPIRANLIVRLIDLVLFGFSSVFILLKKKYLKEFLFILILYISQVALYSYTFAFSRYAITLFFLRFIIIGIGLELVFQTVKEKRLKKTKK